MKNVYNKMYMSVDDSGLDGLFRSVRIQKNLEVKPEKSSGLCGCDNPAEYSSLNF